jgi:hypothetical protein
MESEGFEFENIQVFVNGAVNKYDLRKFQKYDINYELDDSYTGNRTVLYEGRNEKYVIQLIYHVSVFDIIIPTDSQLFFKNYIFQPILNYIEYMIQLTCSNYKTSNEIEFKINYYVENNSSASFFNWWEISEEYLSNKYGWKSELVTESSLGKPFDCEYKRIKMRLRFNSSHKIECSSFDYVSNENKPKQNKPKQQNKPKKIPGYNSSLIEVDNLEYLPNALEYSSQPEPEKTHNKRGRGRGGYRGKYRGKYQTDNQ